MSDERKKWVFSAYRYIILKGTSAKLYSTFIYLR